MTPRLNEEIALLKGRFADLEVHADGWIYLPVYPCPIEWGRDNIPIAFQVAASHPAIPPYAFYVPSGLRFNGRVPGNFQDTAPTQPPFPGRWGVFSWAPEPGAWRPASTVTGGSNLYNWAVGFSERLRQGA